MASDIEEIARLSAGARPASPDDTELARLLAGTPPTPTIPNAPAGSDAIAAAFERQAVALRSDQVTLSNAVAALSSVSGSKWGPSTLDGSRVVRVGKAEFRIPRDAEVKQSRRSGTLWVRLNGETFILSELGQLVQTAAERRATRFDLI